MHNQEHSPAIVNDTLEKNQDTPSNIAHDDAYVFNPEDMDQMDHIIAKKHPKNKGKITAGKYMIAGFLGIGVAIALAKLVHTQVQVNTTTTQVANLPDVDKSKIATISDKEQSQRKTVDAQQADIAREQHQSFAPEYTFSQSFASQNTSAPNLTSAPGLPQTMQTQTTVSVVQTPSVESAPQTMASQQANPQLLAQNQELNEKIRTSVLQQAQSITKPLPGQYSALQYQSNISTKTGVEQTAASSTGTQIAANNAKNKIFAAGHVAYASLRHAINSDDGLSQVLASVHGGAYDGATLIGHIEAAPNNIRLHFDQLSPKDGDTLGIQAMAIREEDARAGIAEKIDNHTLSRYASLFTASILKGMGRFAQPETSTITTSGGAVIQQQAPASGKNITRASLAEVGNQLSQEVGREFARPPTYSIPAGQSFALVFTKDVYR